MAQAEPLAAAATPRNPPFFAPQGLTTFTALAWVLHPAVLTLTLQARTTADLRLLAGLTADLETRAAKDCLTDRFRPLIAEAMADTPRQTRRFGGLRRTGTCHCD